MSAAAAPRWSAGFTMLELLVVIGVISVLAGLGIGFLGRTDPQAVGRATLAAELRQAQLTARAEGVPTEVWVRPGRPGEPATVQARLLEPLAAFLFEPREVVLDERLRPQLGGEAVTNGRFGQARRSRPGDRQPLLRWPMAPAFADLRSGFVLRLDLWFDARQAAGVARLLPMLEVVVDDELVPRARLRADGPGGTGTVLAAASGGRPLPLRSWCTLEVGADGQTLWLALDGREIGRVPAEGAPQQGADLVFEISPAEAPIAGVVDEVRWWVFTLAPLAYLPAGLQPAASYRFTFDSRGEPVEQPEVRYLGSEDDR